MKRFFGIGKENQQKNLEDIFRKANEKVTRMIRRGQKGNRTRPNRQMGYISSVHEAKEVLEKIFKLDSYKS